MWQQGPPLPPPQKGTRLHSTNGQHKDPFRDIVCPGPPFIREAEPPTAERGGGSATSAKCTGKVGVLVGTTRGRREGGQDRA